MVKKILWVLVPILIVLTTIGLFTICAGEVEADEQQIIQMISVEEPDELPVEHVNIISDYDDFAWWLWHECQEQGYENFELAFAISRLETGNFTSAAFKNGHNWGGLSVNEKPLSYSNDEEGCAAFVGLLIKYKDMDTAEELGHKWCPINYENWVKNVNVLMTETEVEIYES